MSSEYSHESHGCRVSVVLAVHQWWVQTIPIHSLLQAKRTAQQPQPCPAPTEHHSGPRGVNPGGLNGASKLAALSAKGPDDGSGQGALSTQPRPAPTGCQEGLGTGSSGGFAVSECIICWEAAPNVLLQPCGHICACSGCAALLGQSDCPMCRCKVQGCIVLHL